MTTKEAIASLRRQGVEISYWKLRAMINRGEVPRPPLNSALCWEWQPQHIAAVRSAAANDARSRGKKENDR